MMRTDDDDDGNGAMGNEVDNDGDGTIGDDNDDKGGNVTIEGATGYDGDNNGNRQQQ